MYTVALYMKRYTTCSHGGAGCMAPSDINERFDAHTPRASSSAATDALGIRGVIPWVPQQRASGTGGTARGSISNLRLGNNERAEQGPMPQLYEGAR
ncbi:hypothetical protein EVAR_102846_1 [Eumeta japonica]|uniref:Uncharacterized protein n=1 Tax=Eumeta variegata TaxID=151549 RepID=A0A4C1UP25_EUMVA|nr:hypothetical protein EVAR_102846_1 [Eumeta japonica]